METVDCRSQGSDRLDCRVDGQIQDVEPVGSFSSVPCHYGKSWGYGKRSIWVANRCEARFNVTYTRQSARPQPTPVPLPEPEITVNNPPQSGLASASIGAVIAQGACTGLYPSLGKEGHVFAVPRQCSAKGPDCETVCRKLRKTADNRRLRKTLKKKELSCFNSLHVYDKGPAEVNTAGTQVKVYNSCGGGCGPNYCCCSAQ